MALCVVLLLSAEVFNACLQKNVKQLTGAAIAAHVANGWAGKEPPAKGPAPRVPNAVVNVLSTHASMQQLAGSEAAEGDYAQAYAGSTLGAVVLGTHMEQALASERQKQKVLRRLRIASATAEGGQCEFDFVAEAN